MGYGPVEASRKVCGSRVSNSRRIGLWIAIEMRPLLPRGSLFCGLLGAGGRCPHVNPNGGANRPWGTPLAMSGARLVNDCYVRAAIAVVVAMRCAPCASGLVQGIAR